MEDKDGPIIEGACGGGVCGWGCGIGRDEELSNSSLSLAGHWNTYKRTKSVLKGGFFFLFPKHLNIT